MSKRPNIKISNETDGAVKDYADNLGITKSEGYEQLLQFALNFRPPTEDELEHLIQYHIDGNGYTREEAVHLTKHNANIAVLDQFVSGSPGYVGPLIFAVYGYPETYTLYAYEDLAEGTLHEVNREAQ